MRVGGNDQCIQFLKQYGIPKNMPIPQKYNTPAAMLYKDRIDAAANGRPLPTELPTTGGGGNSHGSQSGNMSGAGSAHSSSGNLSGGGGGGHSSVAQGTDPLPGESEADYVARQRKLQEEVYLQCVLSNIILCVMLWFGVSICFLYQGTELSC